MLGAIIGDIIGSRWEFNPTNEYNFELFSDENFFTDDTVCTIAVADAILKQRGYGESLHDWCRRYNTGKVGYGGRFRQWVESSTPAPYGSYGNGSAMRVSPVGMYFRTEHDVMEQARLSAECTHSHEAGIRGAQAVACAILRASQLTDGIVDPAAVVEEVLEFPVSYGTDFGFDLAADMEAYRNRFDETCQGTIPPAMRIIAASYGFEDAVRKAVSLGADADTLGAIVGSIAEHIWGVPAWMKEKAMTYLPEEMRQVVGDFYAACQARTEYRPKDRRLKQHELLMLWKLGYTTKNGGATAADAGSRIKPMPSDDVADMETDFPLSAEKMDVIREGHLPASADDNWIMTCDDTTIRFYRNMTGACMFEAQYVRADGQYVIKRIKSNRRIAALGVNSDSSAKYLFYYLIHSTASGHNQDAWQLFFEAWKMSAMLDGEIEDL